MTTPKRILVSFCNLLASGTALGVYDLDADHLDWVDLSGVGVGCYGATGLCRRDDGFWCLLQLAPSMNSGLAHLDPDGRVARCWTLEHTGDAHDLIPYGDGFLIADTTHNRLNHITFAGDGQVLETEFWRADEAETDTAHLNSVVECGGQLYACVLGGRATPTGRVVGFEGQIINVTTGRVVAELLNQPHGLASAGDTLYWLESGASRVHRLAPTGQSGIVMKLKGYLRGLEVAGDTLLIGASVRRSRSRSTGTPLAPTLTEDDDHRHSWLYQLNTETLEVEQRQMTAWGAEIYDLQVIPEGWLSAVTRGDRWQAVVTRLRQVEAELLWTRDSHRAKVRELNQQRDELADLRRQLAEAQAVQVTAEAAPVPVPSDSRLGRRLKALFQRSADPPEPNADD